ncbi:NAD(P)/FAD-dependent oxidoreductase [Aestuariibius sp. 2305UL40-4]|uniref:NAD(P)/FAD-dependent oxidoreductase n=1 Tax=Aestuariibius violaceus TaxID=3234132 RepID=UPI00345EF4C4
MTKRGRVAVIGGGISGMGAAHFLGADREVVLFEGRQRLGGHARTKVVDETAVDTGFIVFNYPNYPHLAALFDHFGVPIAESDMSFGASFEGGRLQFGLKDVGAVFAQKKNAFDPRFWRMIRDILRFNRNALAASADAELTIRNLLQKLRTGDYFRDRYLLPLTGAIWSTPLDKILDFPAHAMLRFMENHALLATSGQHQWYTVKGGSVEYVRRLETELTRQGVDLRIAAPVQAVKRETGGVLVKAQGAEWEQFDDVVFAVHSDDALRMIEDPSEHEQASLGDIRYQPNHVVLHSDASVMPGLKKVWSSWTYVETSRSDESIDLTYWMNSLQPLPKERDFFVTLNSQQPIREELTHDETILRHPVYDLPALAAQGRIAERNGEKRTWFCGAWMKNGFHEDGLSSAIDVVEAIRAREAAAVAAE